MGSGNPTRYNFQLFGFLGSILLDDVSLDGMVNLLDVAPFIER